MTILAAPHRALKKVPLDFDWELDKTWLGYRLKHPICMAFSGNNACEQCKIFCETAGINNDFICTEDHSIEPPVGEGYQMWETTSEGSPQTPVFKTLDELLKHCVRNCTLFSKEGGNMEDWRKVLIDRECTEMFKSD